MRVALLALLAGSAISPAAGEETYRPLRGRDIAVRFVGREFTDGTHWSYAFRRNGVLTSVSLGKPGRGTWRVDGDRLCMTGGPGQAECYRVWMAGEAVQLRPDADALLIEEGVLRRP